MKRFQNIEVTVREMQNNSHLNYSLWKMVEDIQGCMIKGINSAGSNSSEIISFTVLDDQYFILATSSKFILDMLQVRKGE